MNTLMLATDILEIRHMFAYSDALLFSQEQLRLEDQPQCMLRVYDGLLRRKYEFALWINNDDVDPDEFFTKIHIEVLRDTRVKVSSYEQQTPAYQAAQAMSGMVIAADDTLSSIQDLVGSATGDVVKNRNFLN